MPDEKQGDSPASPQAAPPTASSPAGATPSSTPAPASGDAASQVDLSWVWLEVRKRVFIKLPFSRLVAEVMEAAVPIALDHDTFVCGLPPAKYPLAGHVNADQVRNTIESILRTAAGRNIRFEIIEGTTPEDWHEVKQRRLRAQEAVIAMASQSSEQHHFEDVLNQVVGEIRHRVTTAKDRNFPQVRAQLVLDIVPLLSDTADVLFPDRDSHEARRAMARTIDRVAGFVELPPMSLALEIERYRREHHIAPKNSANAAGAQPTPIKNPATAQAGAASASAAPNQANGAAQAS